RLLPCTTLFRSIQSPDARPSVQSADRWRYERHDPAGLLLKHGLAVWDLQLRRVTDLWFSASKARLKSPVQRQSELMLHHPAREYSVDGPGKFRPGQSISRSRQQYLQIIR